MAEMTDYARGRRDGILRSAEHLRLAAKSRPEVAEAFSAMAAFWEKEQDQLCEPLPGWAAIHTEDQSTYARQRQALRGGVAWCADQLRQVACVSKDEFAEAFRSIAAAWEKGVPPEQLRGVPCRNIDFTGS